MSFKLKILPGDGDGETVTVVGLTVDEALQMRGYDPEAVEYEVID